jgi:hypothetical protein
MFYRLKAALISSILCVPGCNHVGEGGRDSGFAEQLGRSVEAGCRWVPLLSDLTKLVPGAQPVNVAINLYR